MAKLNKESESSSMELVYQYGYVIAKFNNNKIKQAYVDEMKKDATLLENIGSFDTFEECCNKIGESSEEVLLDVCYDCINTSDATHTRIGGNGDKTTDIYMSPNATGEVRIENTLTNETKSLEIGELDEYRFDPDAWTIGITLEKFNGENYEKVWDIYNITLIINNSLRYSGSVYGECTYMDYAPEIQFNDIVDLNIFATIGEKTIHFSGKVKYQPK